MQPERTPQNRPQEPQGYERKAQDLRERLQSGLLAELVPYPQFVVWKYTVEQGKLKKRPYDPKTNLPARTNDSTTWGRVEQSLKALAKGRYNGIGFVFADSDPFTGTDLDSCVSKDGTIAPWAQEIITILNTYTEYSPSKSGVHLLTQATLQGAGRKTGTVEMYATERFFTITTDQVPGTPSTIERRQEEIANLYKRFASPVTNEIMQNTGSGVGRGSTLTELPPEAVHDRLLQQLLRGDTSGYQSPSNADFVLIMKLLHWTGDNIELTRQLFKASGLYRQDKTERKTGETTYLDMTIRNALRKRRNPPMKR